jgi:cysteine synthase A
VNPGIGGPAQFIYCALPLEAIPDDEALEMTRRLASEEGIFAGISAGANVIGAHRLAERLGTAAVVVTIAVDTGSST